MLIRSEWHKIYNWLKVLYNRNMGKETTRWTLSVLCPLTDTRDEMDYSRSLVSVPILVHINNVQLLLTTI